MSIDTGVKTAHIYYHTVLKVRSLKLASLGKTEASSSCAFLLELRGNQHPKLSQRLEDTPSLCVRPLFFSSKTAVSQGIPRMHHFQCPLFHL